MLWMFECGKWGMVVSLACLVVLGTAGILLLGDYLGRERLSSGIRTVGGRRVISARQKIFFVETSCIYNSTKQTPGGQIGGVALSPREACAVYSAAQLHPERDIFLYHSCPLFKDYYNRSSRAVKEVLSLPNFHLVRLGRQPEAWLRGSPVKRLLDRLVGSPHRVIQAADVLRYLLLLRHGGTYLDLDMLLVRDLNDLGENWAGRVGKGLVGTAALNLGRDQMGHRLAWEVLARMPSAHRPLRRDSIGPQLFTDVLTRVCNLNIERLREDKSDCVRSPRCGFLVLPEAAFYPVPLVRHPELTRRRRACPLPASSRATRTWARITANDPIEPGSILDRLATIICPPVAAATLPGQL